MNPALVPANFERHAFISYAHIDNEPLTPEQKGWVSRFHSTLVTMLSQRIGQRADIWRDDKLTGNDMFADEIVDQFARTALLISVLTPRYLKSEWCTREMHEFCKAAEKTGGLLVDNKCRVFKVIKTPVDDEARLPPIIGQVLGYEFFDFDDDQTPRELDPAFGETSRQEFLRKLNKLSWDIAQLWSHLAPQDIGASQFRGAVKLPSSSLPVPATVRPAVYLAEVSRDQRAAREMLDSELRRHGYRVLPERRLPLDEAALIAAVDECLNESACSVHLVGHGYGVVPDGPSHRSLVVLQNERAAAQSLSRSLPRLIWLPAGTIGEQAAQQAFIAALRSDAAVQQGADLLTGDLESVKGALHAALARIEAAARAVPPPPPDATADGRRIYLLCDERDRRDIVPLIRELRAAGLAVSTPVFTGDAAAVREANQQRLTDCDEVLLFYGAGDEAWKFHQENELRRMAGILTDVTRSIHGPRAVPSVQVYLSAPLSPDKELLASLGGPGLIDGISAAPPSALAPFIESLAARPAR